MNHLTKTVVAVAAAASLAFLSACGDQESSADTTGTSIEKKESPAPKAPVRTNPNRMDFGDGEVTLPEKSEERSTDRNRSRLEFGDDGRA